MKFSCMEKNSERLSRNRFGQSIYIVYANKIEVKLFCHYVDCYGILGRNQEPQ